MGKRILIVSPTPTHPQTAGNRSRILTFAEAFRSLDHEVDFVHLTMEAGDEDALRAYWGPGYHAVPYSRPRNTMGSLRRRLGNLTGNDAWRFAYGVDDWYDPALGAYVRDLNRGGRYDTVIVEYVFLSRVLEAFGPGTRKILDTHDVFTSRHQRYLDEGMRPHWFSTTRAQEAKGLSRADTIVAIQTSEADYFRRITDREVVTVGHMVRLARPNDSEVVPGRMLFVGSRNVINKKAVDVFVQRVLPRVKTRVGPAHLAVAGSVCDAVVDHPDLVKLGIVDDLSQAYSSADLVVVPMTLGTGLKIKTIEALGWGKPVVSTAIGAEGLESWAGTAFRMVEGVDDLGAEIVQMLLNRGRKSFYAEAASRFSRDWNNRCTEAIKRLI